MSVCTHRTTKCHHPIATNLSLQHIRACTWTRASCGDLALGNVLCLNWKTVVGRRESVGPVVTRNAPNCDTRLYVQSSLVQFFISSYKQEWRNAFRKRHVGTVTPIACTHSPRNCIYDVHRTVCQCLGLCRKHTLSTFPITREKNENTKAQMKVMYFDYITAFTEKLCLLCKMTQLFFVSKLTVLC
jgi:hypothetical protein